MATQAELSPERFKALAHELAVQVRGAVPVATFQIERGSDAYCCASWQLNECAARELFVEQPGRAIAPSILRVGVYFQDSALVSARPDAFQTAFETLRTHRAALQSLGVVCTFTPGSDTRDDRIFGWSDHDLTEWLTDTSDNRDLVWLSNLRAEEPGVQRLAAILATLLPIWLSWNSL